METDLRSETWRKIWERKYAGLDDTGLHVADGYDELSSAEFEKMAKQFLNLVSIRKGTRVLEVGCGAGAFLQHASRDAALSGVDYSHEAIRAIRKRMPGAFSVADAAALPFPDNGFDVVFSFGVFIYFDALAYAETVLREMVRVTRPGGRIFIGDLNDADKKDLYRKLRVEKDADAERKVMKSATVDHLFFSKSYFIKMADTVGCEVDIIDEDTLGIPSYSCARYRFSVIFNRV